MGNARIQIFHWRVGSYEKWLPISVLRERKYFGAIDLKLDEWYDIEEEG